MSLAVSLGLAFFRLVDGVGSDTIGVLLEEDVVRLEVDVAGFSVADDFVRIRFETGNTSDVSDSCLISSSVSGICRFDLDGRFRGLDTDRLRLIVPIRLSRVMFFLSSSSSSSSSPVVLPTMISTDFT